MSATETAEFTSLRGQVQGLRNALRSRAVIEQAVGILQAVHGTDPEQAFDRLVRLSQQHNVKLRKLAAVLVELTAEAGPDTAAEITRRLNGDDSLIELASERNHKRGPEPGERLPATFIEAARELVAARDATPTTPGQENHVDGRLRQARVGLYAELIRLGWVPPFPVTAEISDVLDSDPLMPDPDE